MFIIEPIKIENANKELKLLYMMIKRKMGFIPPHFELFATIDIESMKEFLSYQEYFLKHERIDSQLLPFLRLYIANKECRNYCINFNTQILKESGLDEKAINDFVDNISNIPVENSQKTLLNEVINALYDSQNFNQNNLQKLYSVGFNDKDFFDLLRYATTFISNSKLIEVYIK